MQNRESASRVRSRKRTQMELFEDEMRELKRKNEELMLINASITAENNLLKQQVSFLQKLVVKSGGENEVQQTLQPADPESKYILPVTQERIRGETPRSIGKHFSILGIFTVLIFVLTGGWPKNGESTAFSEQFRGRFDRGVKSFDQDAIEYLLGQYEIWKTVSFATKYLIIGVYAGYVCWILYQFLIKKYVRLKIKEI